MSTLAGAAVFVNGVAVSAKGDRLADGDYVVFGSRHAFVFWQPGSSDGAADAPIMSGVDRHHPSDVMPGWSALAAMLCATLA